jgi:ATP-dependent Clp protease ATP-binding subunit ClpC
MFERFTESARQVIVLAQDEARLLKHNYIGTEHLLLGLLRQEEGVAAVALDNLGVTLVKVRAQVARIVGKGDEVMSGQIPFTPRSKKVIELALREALSIGHNYVGSEHILLGIVRENEGVAARILLEFDADALKIRSEIMRLLTGPDPPRVHARWEYDVLHVEEIEEKHLNGLAAEGWELIAVAGPPGDFRLVVRRVG